MSSFSDNQVEENEQNRPTPGGRYLRKKKSKGFYGIFQQRIREYIRSHLPRLPNLLLLFLDLCVKWIPFLIVLLSLMLMFMEPLLLLGRVTTGITHATYNTIWCGCHPILCGWEATKYSISYIPLPAYFKKTDTPTSDTKAKSSNYNFYYDNEYNDDDFTYTPYESNENLGSCTPDVEENVFTIALTRHDQEFFTWLMGSHQILEGLRSSELYLPDDITFTVLVQDLEQLMRLTDSLSRGYTQYLAAWSTSSQETGYSANKVAIQIQGCIKNFEAEVREACRYQHHWTKVFYVKKCNSRAKREVETIKLVHKKHISTLRTSTMNLNEAGRTISQLLQQVNQQILKIQRNEIQQQLKGLEDKLHPTIYTNLFDQIKNIFTLSTDEDSDTTFNKPLLEQLRVQIRKMKTETHSQLQQYTILINDWYVLPQKENMKCIFPGILVFDVAWDAQVLAWIEKMKFWCESRKKISGKIEETVRASMGILDLED